MSVLKQGVTLRALLQGTDLINYDNSSTVIDGLKKKDTSFPAQSAPRQSAFLGPTIWDQNLPADMGGFGGDFLKLEHLDLDDFLSENDIPSNEELNQLVGDLDVEQVGQLSQGCSESPKSPRKEARSRGPGSPESTVNSQLTDDSSCCTSPTGEANSLSDSEGIGVRINFPLNETDVAVSTIPGEKQFDPRKRTFSVDELKPQPVLKKSKKIYVCDELKDDRYWQRRKKNNIAAKRSRDARRVKENQITLRASYLETENNSLKDELKKVKKDNEELQRRLAKYEDVRSSLPK